MNSEHPFTRDLEPAKSHEPPPPRAHYFFRGLAVTIQPSINARLAQKIGLIESAFVSFLWGRRCCWSLR